MRRKLYFTSLLILLAASLYAQYIPDVLGDGYLRRTFQMPDDYEGKVVCTLVKKPQLPDVKQAVLYIHGYNDYFFQKQLGDSVNAHGYNFYAMDHPPQPESVFLQKPHGVFRRYRYGTGNHTFGRE